MRSFWLIYDRAGAEKNKDYIALFARAAARLRLQMTLLLAEELSYGVLRDELYLAARAAESGEWVCISSADVRGETGAETVFLPITGIAARRCMPPSFVIVRTILPLLSQQIEAMGIPVFNCAETARICNDKALTHQYVTRAQVPMTDTVFCNRTIIEERLAQAPSGTIIKAVDGHGGTQVYQLSAVPDAAERSAIAHGLAPSSAVFQPFAGTRRDLRVYLIGNEPIAAVLRTATEGFRANFSRGGAVQLYTLSEEERQTVRKISALFHFGMVGIDFLIDKDGALRFNEIEDVVGARMLYQCRPEVDLPEQYLTYILSSI